MDERHGNDDNHDAPGFPRLSGGAGGGDGGDYDALAELFLGDPELGPAPATATGRRMERPATVIPTQAPVVPPMHERALEGGPAPRHVAEVETGERCVEVVVLGHLPVRASIWVRQYANSVGTALGRPVGLLRIGADASSVELIGPGAERLPLANAEPTANLESAVRSVAGLADRWIVRVDETAEPGLAESACVDEVTILTGSDEAAVVASYRLVKSLAAAWDKAFGAEGGPSLGLAIMGSSGEQALAAGEKLERAAASFLNRPVRVTARVPKVGVSSAATIYRGSEDADAEHVIGLIRAQEPTGLRLAEAEGDALAGLEVAEGVLEEIEDAGDAGVTEPSGEIADDAGVAEEIVFEAEDDDGADFGHDAREDEPEEAAVTPPEQPMIVTRAVTDVTPRRLVPVSDPEPVRASGEVEGAELIEGLGVLESECPYTPGVRLAADGAGRLHLVADDSDGSDEAVRQLTAAGTWATAHLKLLRRAEPSLGEHAGAPVAHLLTNDAKRVRTLLDSEIRVHLVTRVTLGGQSGQVAVALN
ncbi:MAG: hypothetical protein DHS20C14_09350 [Phycisphaeraceae bacterium]|nr:MAG: hypothetical protein DHS20C14_09350 [Phycisphaeraceae bacterium]